VRIVLLGSETRILDLAQKHGLPRFESKVDILNPFKGDHTDEFAEHLFALRQRKGVTHTTARELAHNPDYFAAMLLKLGRVDGVVSGVVDPYAAAVKPLLEVIGVEKGHTLAGIYMVMHRQRQYFFADCTVNVSPDAAKLADIAVTTAEVARRYTKDPIRVGMLSFASFGATKHEECRKVAEAVRLVRAKAPGVEVDGEMQADVALNPELRQRDFPFSTLTGNANVLVFPDLAASNIAYKLLAAMSGASLIGPILVGMTQPANVLQISATTDEIVNMIYVTAHQALLRDG
jgi:malate dehydrogenase (oxaloacetate-decarboxylating)(NADP+)